MTLLAKPAICARVVHPKYGPGKVIGVKGITGYGSLVVKYDNKKYGTKEVLWIWAKENMNLEGQVTP